MPQDTIYHLTLRPSAAKEASDGPDAVVGRLLRIPGVREVEPRRYEFGEADEHGIMRLEFEAAAVEISIPRTWVQARGPQVFALVFMLAEWLGWEVYDSQIEDVLVKETVLQGMVAMRQAQRERDLREKGPSGGGEA